MAIFGGLNTLRKQQQFSDRLGQASIPQQTTFPVGMAPSQPIMVDGQRANPGPDALMKMARPAPDQRKGGGGLRRFFENFRNDILPRLTAAGAIANGDYGAAAQIQAAYMRQAQARQESEASAEQFQRLASQVASLPGMNAREFATFLGNPEQWAANMSDALATHHAAANVGQTETRVYGNPNAGGDYYQPPRLIENGADQIRHDPMTGENTIAFSGMTTGEQYARSLRLQPGSPEWNSAVRDAELGANGPTAFGYDQQLEAMRQQGRQTLRGMPTYSQANPRPRASGGGSRSNAPARSSGRPTATGPNGEKIEWNGRAWVPSR